MKKVTLSILVAYVFTCLIQPLAKADDSYEISKYFPMNVGNKWAYSMCEIKQGKSSENIIHSVIQTKDLLNGKEVYLFERDIGRTPIFYYSLGKDGVYLHKIVKDDGDVVFSQPVIAFPDNLQLNQEISGSREFKVYDIDGNVLDEGNATAKIRFGGFKNIIVPAGKFANCLEIESLFILKTKRFSSVILTTTWLAQDVGKVKEKEKVREYNGAISEIYTEIELKGGMIEGKSVGDFDIRDKSYLGGNI
ncbi:MAG: hypothetical protein ISS45_04580 [Candidatus Omnitrophica bacterium]|nr:hypothetical protein [Candidatus Omnitrophota bacterium]